MRGGNFATSASLGSIASLPSNPSGTLSATSSLMRATTGSRQSTPSASDMRRSDPKRLIATGYRDLPPLVRVGWVNSSAGPPPADFMQRSAISVTSLSTETGRSTRTRSPRSSIAPMKARRLSSAIVDGADPAGQPLERDARESGVREAARERFRLGKREHRLWQVGIGISMFRDQPADGRENSPEVEQIQRAQRREAWRRELEDDETGTRPEDAIGFPQTAVQIREVANAESHHRTVEPRRGKGELQGVGGDGRGSRRLVAAPREHGDYEVSADHAAAEAVPAGQLRGEVERAGAEVEIDAVRFRLPAEPRHRGAAPEPIHVEAQQMVQEVVTRRDRGEHATHVGWRTSHRRER